MVSLPPPMRSSCFVSARAFPQGRRCLPGPGLRCAGSPSFRLTRMDANGISQVFRRSFPCLCSVPRPRSNRRALAITVTSMPPPLCAQRRLRAMLDFGANPQLQHLLSYASCFALPLTRKARFRLAGSAFAGRESNPLESTTKEVSVHMVIPLSCPPDATHVPHKSQIELSAPPTCRMPLGQSRASPKLVPEGGSTPGFGIVVIRFRHFCSGSLALASANDARFFTGPYQRRLIPIVGHDTPQEAPAAVTAAVLDLIRC